MAELEDLEEHLTAVRSQNASLIGEISSKNVVPAYMVLKHQRSIDMSTSLKWSTDERFTEREGRAELKRWLRCHPSPFSEEALSLR